jgi:hypothetical protein
MDPEEFFSYFSGFYIVLVKIWVHACKTDQLPLFVLARKKVKRRH